MLLSRSPAKVQKNRFVLARASRLWYHLLLACAAPVPDSLVEPYFALCLRLQLDHPLLLENLCCLRLLPHRSAAITYEMDDDLLLPNDPLAPPPPGLSQPFHVDPEVSMDQGRWHAAVLGPAHRHCCILIMPIIPPQNSIQQVLCRAILELHTNSTIVSNLLWFVII